MSDEEAESSSWWNVGKSVQSNLGGGVTNLWSKAKETGSYVYEFTSHDFNEVAESLKQDVIVPSASALKHQLQPHAQYGSLTDSVTTMLGNVSEYLAPEPQHDTVYLSRYGDDRIAAIQSSQDTYLQHQVGEDYIEWANTFVLEQHTHQISQILVDNVKLRVLHTSLVPAEISYTNFWKIYYYRTHLFNEDKKRHEEILERAGKEQTEEEELKWSDEEDEEEEEGRGGDQITLTEEPGVVSQGSDKTNTPDNSVNTSQDPTTVPTLPLPENVTDKVADELPTRTDTESMHSSAVLSEIGDHKTEVSSDGSYELVKHKDVIEEEEAACTSAAAGPQQPPKEDDEEFEKELDQMMENINVEETMSDGDDKWEDWE